MDEDDKEVNSDPEQAAADKDAEPGTGPAIGEYLLRLQTGINSIGKMSHAARLEAFTQLVKNKAIPTIVPALSLLLNLDGRPYSLVDYFTFEDLYRLRMPKMSLLKTGRQLGKSQNLAGKWIIASASIPNFKMLYVCPLYEQIRRFSANYVRPFIETSPVRELLTGTHTINSVLQRSFKNNAQMIFSFAQMNADRCRGISSCTGLVSTNGCQDMESHPGSDY